MPKNYLPSVLRISVAERAGYLCEYCRCRSDCACESFEVEHIIPTSKGGTDDVENLAYSCRGCNSRKSDRTEAIDPFTQKYEPIFHPRLHLWEDHFAWDDTYEYVLGISPVGRATTQALQLNRKGVINLRKLMKLGGIHPPSKTYK